MSLLVAQNLSKFYGPDEVFSDISVDIPQRSRIALVGPNGAGKTTLLNLLIGLDVPTEGTVTTAKGTNIGFLPQRPELVGEHTLWEEQLKGVAHLRDMEARLSELEHDMAAPDKYEAALAAYGPLQEQFELAGGYTYENRIKMVLQGVGFDPEDYTVELPKLSGGQKTRALLSRLLLEEPDLLILDEPTNHLDIYAVEWLEAYLRDFPGAVLVVSHDRYFMDRFASTIWELDYGTIEVYRGNYSHYVRQRDERHERHIKEFEAQQEYIAKEQAFIRKHMGSRLTAQAKGRQKRLETMRKRGKIITRPRGERKDMNIRLEASIRSGDKVIMTSDLAVGYPDDEHPLFNVPDITLYRGETAALIGPNGVGKSTFMKTIIGQLEPLAGQTEIGASVKIAYFAQAHELLDPKHTLVDAITEIKPMPISEARSYLGKFLFSGDEVFRTVETLSGGERGRLALARLSLGGANLLLLDEPTNHLDIDSQEVLQEVLAEFPGTILLISHDRYLIDALATQIWAAQPGELNAFKGTYREYLDNRQKQVDAATTEANAKAEATKNGAKPSSNGSTSKKKHGLNPYQLKKRLQAVEDRIHELETEMETLTEAIGEASTAGDSAKVSTLGEQYSATEAELEALMEEWELLLED